MKIKLWIIGAVALLFLAGGGSSVFALEHAQKNGLFSMDIPEGWHSFENSHEIYITFMDGKTIAIDIQFAPSRKLSDAESKKAIKDSNDKFIKEGIEAHQAILIDNKEISLNGTYATQIDFKTTPQDLIYVTYIAFFNKGYAYTITYGSGDPKIHEVMEDAVATIKFK